MKRFALRAGFILLVLLSGFAVWLPSQYMVPILMYHHVGDNPRSKSQASMVSPENFARQMKYLHDHRYHVMSLDELVTAIAQKRDLPRNSVVITFDDGYENNYTRAFPVLRQYGFPATIFLISDLVGEEGYLTWEQIREMQAAGLSFGSHTRRHPFLPVLDDASARDEIINSRKILEEKLGQPVLYLAYPSGGYNEKIEQITREAGYKGAVTTNRGFARLNRDVYALKRVRFVNKSSRWPTIWLQLSGYYNVFRQPRDPD